MREVLQVRRDIVAHFDPLDQRVWVGTPPLFAGHLVDRLALPEVGDADRLRELVEPAFHSLAFWCLLEAAQRVATLR